MGGTVDKAEGDANTYDAFVCYNSEDQSEAVKIAEGLTRRSVRVFEASTSIEPGKAWLTELGSAIRSSRSALVLVGKGGGQRWAGLELSEIIVQQQKRRMRVIPVLLPGVSPDAEDPPFLFAFQHITLGPNESENLDKLLAAIQRDTPIVITKVIWWKRIGEIAFAAARWKRIGVVVVAALVVAAMVRARIRWTKQLDISKRIGTIIAARDWQRIGELAGEGPLAVSPIDERLLQDYWGQGTPEAISALMAIARHKPDAVCPLFARIVGFAPGRRYPELTYEEVASQMADSPCANQPDLVTAQASARESVTAALASPEVPDAFKNKFATYDNVDCEALARLRRLLRAPGPPACNGGATPGGKAGR
jgi:hypothetical protein